MNETAQERASRVVAQWMLAHQIGVLSHGVALEKMIAKEIEEASEINRTQGFKAGRLLEANKQYIETKDCI